jgi:hypothetical protein
MINQMLNDELMNKITGQTNKSDLRLFIHGVNIIYRFRNMMGAHEGYHWDEDQAATSCLILTFYLADLYIWSIRKRIDNKADGP